MPLSPRDEWHHILQKDDMHLAQKNGFFIIREAKIPVLPVSIVTEKEKVIAG